MGKGWDTYWEVSSHYVGERKPQCFKCKGYGHYAQDCYNARVMIIGPHGDIYNVDEDEVKHPKEGDWCPDTNPGFSSGGEIDVDARSLVVLRNLNVQPKLDEHNEQRTNIFYMKCKVMIRPRPTPTNPRVVSRTFIDQGRGP